MAQNFRPITPSDGPGWLPRFADSVADLFRRILPAPLRLKDYATADLPAAADFSQGLAYNLTSLNVAYSDGAGWHDLLTTTGTAAAATKLATARTIGITGDLTWTSPAFDGTANVTAAGTLATVNSNVGSFGSATQAGTFTVNAKGLITAAANVTITPAASSIIGAAALTKTDDTNVTLTLAGSPATALLAAASLTLGWTGQLSVARGGTSFSSYTTGDLIQASASGTLAKLAAVATGNVLISGGVGVVSSWGKVGLTTHVSGTLPIANGGTNQTSLGDITRTNDTNVTLTLGGTPTGALITSTSFTLGWSGQLAVTRGGSGLSSSVLGDIWYGSAANTMAALAGNTTSTKKWLNQTGTGTVSAAPGWSTIANTDVSGLGTMSTQVASAVAITGGTAYGLSGQFTGNSVSSGAGTEVLNDGTIGYCQAFNRTSVAWLDLYVRGLTVHLFAAGADQASVDTSGINLASGKVLRVAATQVVQARITGWAAATNTKSKATFDTTTVTTAQLAARVGQLIDDLMTHGLIGT